MEGRRRRSVAGWVLSLVIGVIPLTAQTFTEYPIPTADSRPSGMTLGPDGAIWFTEYLATKIARIDDSGAVTEYAIPDPNPSGRSRSIASGPDGNLWFTSGSGVWRATPSAAFTQFSIAPAIGPGHIISGPDGNLWFSVVAGDGGDPSSGYQIGRMTTTGALALFPINTDGNVDGLTNGPDGNVWFTLNGPTDSYVERITPSGVITEFSLPPFDAYATSITSGSDGNLWFVAEPKSSGNSAIGRMTTSGVVTYFPLQEPLHTGSTSITSAPDGTLWFSISDPGGLAQITTSGDVTAYPPPTPSKTFTGVAAGPDGSIWVAEYSANNIGRLGFGAPTHCTPDATTLCLNDNRFRVTASWRKNDGTIGDGTAIPLTADSGYFWFFNSANIELVVKALNACSINPPHYWVFAAGLTNVEVTMTVTDTQTGSSNVYTNPLGTAFVPIQDTSAFATCP